MEACGGFLGGIAAVAGLIFAQPDLVTMVIPPDRLVQVVERVDPTALPQAIPTVQTTPPQATAQQGVTQMPGPAESGLPMQALQGDLEAAIVSIADTPDAFLANVRLINKSQTEALFAGRMKESGYSGDFQLTDMVGGSCPWKIKDSTFSLGSLAVTPILQQMRQLSPSDAAQFMTVHPWQVAIVTLKFNKNTCDNMPSGNSLMNLSGT